MITSAEIERLLSQLQYKRDVRRPPDERRRSQFCVGWEDATVRGVVYTEKTLEHLTWYNLGYRLGRFFGYQSLERIHQAYEILVSLYKQSESSSDWRAEVRRWLRARRNISPPLEDKILSFFELAFENTRYPEHAWFGVHKSIISFGCRGNIPRGYRTIKQ